MKKSLAGVVFLAWVGSAHGVDVSTVVVPSPTVIRHPPQGAVLPYLPRTFVYGSTDPRGQLILNGQPVPIHPGGGFLGMVDLSTGPFEIRALLTLGTTTWETARQILVSAPPEPLPMEPPRIESILPAQDITVSPGDVLRVSARGSRGGRMEFRLQGRRGWWPMVETSSGHYVGVYHVQPGDRLKEAPVKLRLKTVEKNRAHASSSGQVKLWEDNPPQVALVSQPDAVMRAGPELANGSKPGYFLYPPQGTRLELSGQRGAEWRVRLSPTREGWVSDSQITLLPKGTPPPRVRVGSLGMATEGLSTFLRVPLGEAVPFEILASPLGDALTLRFFGAYSDTDWALMPRTPRPVKSWRWAQEETSVFSIELALDDKAWWGYDARYEGSTFVLELRSPPARQARPLGGLLIALDAGHSPDTGAIGPTGVLERDVNRSLAEEVARVLVAEGARVIQVRPGEESVGLTERTRRAWAARADILLSLHQNAPPEGANALERRGFGLYYFHPHSLPLARELHEAFYTRLGPGSAQPRLRDDGLHYANLALARPPQMPAVLIESGYMTVPEEEALLASPDFLKTLAQTIVSGLQRYVEFQRSSD